MRGEDLTLSDIHRLVVALEQAPQRPDVIQAIIARVPPEPIAHGRVTIASLLRLLESTNGSTVLPEAVVQLLNTPEPAMPELTPPPVTAPLLETIGQVEMPSIALFRGINHFTNHNPDRIALDLSDLFKSHFQGQVETAIAPTILAMHRLTQTTTIRNVFDALGNRAVCRLAHLWELLKRQPHGEPGLLLTNSDVNIFFVHDQDYTLYTVYVIWQANRHCWLVRAYFLSQDQRCWEADRRVFSS